VESARDARPGSPRPPRAVESARWPGVRPRWFGRRSSIAVWPTTGRRNASATPPNPLDPDARPRSRVVIAVVDNQIEPALKMLKRELNNAGIFKEMRRRAYYEKPSVKRKRKIAEAARKRRKAARRSIDAD